MAVLLTSVMSEVRKWIFERFKIRKLVSGLEDLICAKLFSAYNLRKMSGYSGKSDKTDKDWRFFTFSWIISFNMNGVYISFISEKNAISCLNFNSLETLRYKLRSIYVANFLHSCFNHSINFARLDRFSAKITYKLKEWHERQMYISSKNLRL